MADGRLLSAKVQKRKGEREGASGHGDKGTRGETALRGGRMISSGMGRDVIAITSVGGRIMKWPVTLPGSTHAPMRTAVMAMTTLPKAP